jgi:hypothetical protein
MQGDGNIRNLPTRNLRVQSILHDLPTCPAGPTRSGDGDNDVLDRWVIGPVLALPLFLEAYVATKQGLAPNCEPSRAHSEASMVTLPGNLELVARREQEDCRAHV